MSIINVHKKSPLFESIEETWQTVYDLLDINRIKGAGERYLHRHPAEDTDSYLNRLSQSTFFDYFKRNLVNATSVITRNEIEFSTLSEQQETFMLNVDLEGRDINSFIEDTTFHSLGYGIHYVLVDHTNTDENVAQGRPYWVDIPARNVIMLKTQRVDDQEQLMDFRFFETVTGEEDFNINSTTKVGNEYDEIDQVRRYFIEDSKVKFEVYRKEATGNYILYNEGGMNNVPIIPIICFYGGMRESFYFSKPPFYSLGTTELRLYNTYSEQTNNLATTRLPILVCKNYADYTEEGHRKELKISPNSVVVGDTDLEINYVESSGAALEQGWRDIDNLKNIIIEMGIGLQPQAPSGDKTATAIAIETAEQHAFLKKVARRFEDTLIKLITLTGMMNGDTNIPDVTISIDLFEENDGRDRTEQNNQFDGDSGVEEATGTVEEEQQ